MLSDFSSIKYLASGHFGSVNLVEHVKTKQTFVLKTTETDILVRNDLKIGQEYELHKQVSDHINIVTMFEMFKTLGKRHMLMEYCSCGDLFKKLQSGHIEENIAHDYLLQVTRAVEYCHVNNIIHRDIKPDNILITTDNILKLTDFGWATKIDDIDNEHMVGTLDYLAPEVILNEPHTDKIDIWQLGIVYYEMLTTKQLFFALNFEETKHKIVNDEPDYHTISENAKQLLNMIIKKNPNKRPTAQQLLDILFLCSCNPCS